MLKMRSFTVGEVNKYIKRILTADPILRQIIVEGEISNLTKHSSGHYYFSLKEDTGKLSCVMFADQTKLLSFTLENGDKITAKGQIAVYEKDGRYQLYVNDMEKLGIGALHIAFEKLKLELSDAGYFDVKFKKELPKFPKTIGVVTSPTGAAIRDIISVYERRSPLSKLLIYPVRVQGPFSKDEICEGIQYFNDREDVDLIILARGGGSIEELWSFNERVVAEAIFKSKCPIVTGVGHEIDFTISDFVADYRAATPSAAAEIAILSKLALQSNLTNTMHRMQRQMTLRLNQTRLLINSKSPIEMARRYQMKIEQSKLENERLLEKSIRKVQTTLSRNRELLAASAEKLSVLSPLNTLDRGYAIVKKEDHAIVSAEMLREGDRIEVTLKDGFVKAEVLSISKQI